LHHRRSGRRTGTLQRCAAVGDDWDDLWSEDLSDTSWGAPPPDPAPRTGSRSRSGSGGAAAADTFPEFEEPSGPEVVAQNALALSLVAILALAAGNVVFKLVVVCWALVTAAVRYCFVATLLLAIAVIFG